MFEAGENLQESTAEHFLTQDYKVFASGGIRFGVGQGSYVSAKNREMAKEMLQGEMEQVLAKENVDMIFYLVTNILDQSSEVLFAGKDADLLLSNAFHCLVKKGQPLLLKGVVSRKKQFIPAMIGGIQNQCCLRVFLSRCYSMSPLCFSRISMSVPLVFFKRILSMRFSVKDRLT